MAGARRRSLPRAGLLQPPWIQVQQGLLRPLGMWARRKLLKPSPRMRVRVNWSLLQVPGRRARQGLLQPLEMRVWWMPRGRSGKGWGQEAPIRGLSL